MLGFVLLSVLLVGSQAGGSTYTADVDKFLAQADKLLKERQASSYPLKEIDNPFHFEFFGRKLNGEFWAKQGQATGLSSIKRVGDVSVVQEGSKVTLTSEFTYGSLSFNFNYFRFQYLTLDVNGKLDVRFPNLRGTIQIGITKNGSGCNVDLQTAKIHDLGEPKVRTRGAKVPIQFHDVMVRFILQSFQADGSEKVKSRTIDAFTESVGLVDFCNA